MTGYARLAPIWLALAASAVAGLFVAPALEAQDNPMATPIFGVSVDEVRKNMGRELAKAAPVDADVVMAVPDSSNPAALGSTNRAFLSTWGSSATTTWAVPSSSPSRASAISACASS